MKRILANCFRFLFGFDFFRSRFFGIHQKVFEPYRIFKGVQIESIYEGFHLTLKLDDWIQENLFFLGKYEEAELKVIDQNLREGYIFIDVGANIGLFSLQASRKVGKTGKVIAFEPFPSTFQHFQKHLQMNQITNVQAENLALGNSDGLVELFYDPDEKNVGMVSTKPLENGIKEEVKITSLDRFVLGNSIDRIDFIKIDVEGHELEAIRGMENALKTFEPVLLIEINADANEKKLLDFLQHLGYKKYFINNDGEVQEENSNPKRRNFIFSKSLN